MHLINANHTHTYIPISMYTYLLPHVVFHVLKGLSIPIRSQWNPEAVSLCAPTPFMLSKSPKDVVNQKSNKVLPTFQLWLLAQHFNWVFISIYSRQIFPQGSDQKLKLVAITNHTYIYNILLHQLPFACGMWYTRESQLKWFKLQLTVQSNQAFDMSLNLLSTFEWNHLWWNSFILNTNTYLSGIFHKFFEWHSIHFFQLQLTCNLNWH